MVELWSPKPLAGVRFPHPVLEIGGDIMKLDKNIVGLALGIFFAIVHALWAILVWIGLAKPFLDFVFKLHFMTMDYSIEAFGFLRALGLLIMTFVVGYVIGWVFSAFWNKFNKA